MGDPPYLLKATEDKSPKTWLRLWYMSGDIFLFYKIWKEQVDIQWPWNVKKNKKTDHK